MNPTFVCLPLEPRRLLSADVGWHDEMECHDLVDSQGWQIHYDPVDVQQLNEWSSAGSTDPAAGNLAAATYPLSTIPALNSNPGATAQLYLDFDGEAVHSWGYNASTPAYDQDGDPSTFSDSELANIQQIWARVAEKYSPFNINVTTVNPGTLADKVALRVVIGGGGSWTGGRYGGVAYVGSFYNSSPNTVYVFEDNLGNGSPKYVAEASAHEAGHGFGLQHQSKYDANGALLQSYSTGTGTLAPIMGNSYSASRGLWWYGTTVSASTFQDDMAVISGSANGFGYRADDHGGSISTATSLILSGSSASGSGIIEKTSDRDYFAFMSDSGTISFTAAVVSAGATLDLKLELWSSAGTLITLADTTSLGESITATVAAGSYRIVVASHGGYGDVGQYTLSGTITPNAAYIAAPTNLSAGVVSASQVSLSWVDQSSNETGFVIERSTDGGASWSTIATTGANVTSHQDTQIVSGMTYIYRVYARSDAADSDFSNSASATPVPMTPASLSATAISNSQITLNWANVTGETGYRIERSADGIGGWGVIGTTSADTTSFQDTGLAMGTSYYYRVVATGLGGDSPASNIASATTQSLTAPAAPSNLLAVASGKNKINLTWTDNSTNESGFYIERSKDGGSWARIATVGANVTSYTNSGLKRGTYSYRVAAFNAAGQSAYSATDSATLGDTAPGGGKGNSTSAASLFSAEPIPGTDLLETGSDLLGKRAGEIWR